MGKHRTSVSQCRGSSTTDSVGVPVLHDDSGSVGGSSEDETVGVDGWEESLAGNDDDIPVHEIIVEVAMARTAVFSDGLASLDVIDPRTLFESRASVLRSVPRFLHGPFRNAKDGSRGTFVTRDVATGTWVEIALVGPQNAPSQASRRRSHSQVSIGAAVRKLYSTGERSGSGTASFES